MAKVAQHAGSRFRGLAQIALGATGTQLRAKDEQLRSPARQAGADRIEQVAALAQAVELEGRRDGRRQSDG